MTEHGRAASMMSMMRHRFWLYSQKIEFFTKRQLNSAILQIFLICLVFLLITAKVKKDKMKKVKKDKMHGS